MILKSLETLKIKLTAQALDELVREATESGMSPWELLDRFLAMPASQSIERAIERRIKNAGLPTSATLESFDLLIIDEFGFDKLERREYPESPSMLYKVVVGRNGRGSTAILTNVVFGDWTEYLGDPALVMALLDRVSDAIVFRFEGESYRKKRMRKGQ